MKFIIVNSIFRQVVPLNFTGKIPKLYKSLNMQLLSEVGHVQLSESSPHRLLLHLVISNVRWVLGVLAFLVKLDTYIRQISSFLVR